MSNRRMSFWKVCVTVAIAGLVLAGCTSQPDSGAGGTARGTTASATATALPGALDSNITKYSSVGIRNFVAGLNPVLGPNQERCSVAPPGCNPKTRAQIAVYDGQQGVGPANANGNNGYGTIVMKMTNTGPASAPTEFMFGLKPGNYVYYMVAYTQGTGMRWELYEVRTDDPNAKPTSIKTGDFAACPGHTQRPSAKGEFSTCDKAPHTTNTPAALSGAESDPAWMTCSAGCCTAGEL